MVFTRCCCCVELQTGCIILAILGILGSFGSLSQGITAFSVASCVIGFITHLMLLIGAITKNVPATIIYLVLEAVAIVAVIAYGVVLIVTYGSVKDEFFAICNADPTCQNLSDEEKEFAIEMTKYLPAAMIVAALLYVYFWLCVYSFLKELKASDTSPNLEMSAMPKA